MGIWDSLRRFSTRGTSTTDSSTKKRLGAGKKRLQARGLRLEKFEERKKPPKPPKRVDLDIEQPRGKGVSFLTESGAPLIMKLIERKRRAA